MAAESLPSIQLGYRSGWKSLTNGSMDIFTISLLHVHCSEEEGGGGEGGVGGERGVVCQ